MFGVQLKVMKKLIINADDFGATKEINQGIQQAILAGRVTSVSLMVEMPYFVNAVRFLRQHPQVAVGLHFNLTEGESHGGLLYTIASLIFGRLSLQSVKKELLEQYVKLKKTGLPISHIDSHENIHIFPPIFKLMYDFAEQYQIPRLRACPFSIGQLGMMRKTAPTLKQLFLWTAHGCNYYLFFKHKKRKKYIPSNIFDLNWHNDFTSKHISQLFSHLPSGTTEIICHLSSTVTQDPLSYDRRECLSCLLGVNFGKILKRYHVS